MAGALKVTNMLNDHFATIGKRTIFVNIPWIMQQLYKVVYYLMPEFTRTAVVVVTNKQLKEGFLLNLFHPDDLEQKFGGNRPDIKSDFFPPDLTTSKNEQFLTQSQVDAVLNERKMRFKQEISSTERLQHLLSETITQTKEDL